MPEIRDKRECSYPGCPAKQVLREKHSPELPIPNRVEAGQPFPPTQKLHVWVCEMNPLHVEVRTWRVRFDAGLGSGYGGPAEAHSA